jgi:hypothetical protein
MGAAKQRKQHLGEKYGTSETANQHIKVSGCKVSLQPDYGSEYVRRNGTTPITLELDPKGVIIASSESYVHFDVDGFLGTLITDRNFAEYIRDNSPQTLTIIPDPDDIYKSQIGERVVPFKLVGKNNGKNN